MLDLLRQTPAGVLRGRRGDDAAERFPVARPSLLSVACVRWQRRLVSLLLCTLLMGSIQLGVVSASALESPFFRESASPSPQPDSDAEMDEAMPELELFPSRDPNQDLPSMGDPLAAPDL
jgi:hypothetical protein